MEFKILGMQERKSMNVEHMGEKITIGLNVRTKIDGERVTFKTPKFVYDENGFHVDTDGLLFEVEMTEMKIEDEKESEKIVIAVHAYLKNSKKYKKFKEDAPAFNERLKKLRYPKVENIRTFHEYGDAWQVWFELEGEKEVDDLFTLTVNRSTEEVYTDIDEFNGIMYKWREYVGWETDIIKQVLNSKTVRLKSAMEPDYVRKYLK